MFHKFKNPSASVEKNWYFKTMAFSISFTHAYRERKKKNPFMPTDVDLFKISSLSTQ